MMSLAVYTAVAVEQIHQIFDGIVGIVKLGLPADQRCPLTGIGVAQCVFS